jgi:hypothetical protein
MTSQAALQTTRAEYEYYHSDYAQITENEQEFVTTDRINSVTVISRRSEGNFPVKLHYILSQAEVDGMDDIVSWQPHGQCFVVHKQNEFVEKILPL